MSLVSEMTRRRSQSGGRFGAIVLTALAVALSAVPTRAAETYQYDAQGRLTDIAYQNGGSFHYSYDANGNIISVVTSLATAVDEAGAPLRFALGPMTPNPGSGPRNITFMIPSSAHITLRVFDVSGREVATLVDHDLPAGRHQVRFFTEGWAAGVYYYRLNMGAAAKTGKMVVVR